MNRIEECRYRDPEGKRGEGCIGKFELNSTQGGSNRKYCDNCCKLAARDRGAKHHANEDPAKIRKRNLDQRRKAAEAAGRTFRPMAEMQPCLYRDREGNPSPDCLVEFKPKTGIQIYCENCRRLARNDRQSAAKLKTYYADKAAGGERYQGHLRRGRKSSARRWARLRMLAALSSEPEATRKIVHYLWKHRTATNSEVRKATRTVMSDRNMSRVRDAYGMKGQRGPKARTL